MAGSARVMCLFACLGLMAMAGCPQEQQDGAKPATDRPGAGGAPAAPARPSRAVYVYSDDAAEANQFTPTGWLGDAEECGDIDPACKDGAQQGDTCVKISYQKAENGWMGLYWLYPGANWGKVAGRNLQGAAQLTFWAKGEKGGEVVHVKVGGVPGPHRDTADVGLPPLTLTSAWRSYAIELGRADLSNVVGGFGVTVKRDENPKGCAFYLDEIRYEMAD